MRSSQDKPCQQQLPHWAVLPCATDWRRAQPQGSVPLVQDRKGIGRMLPCCHPAEPLMALEPHTHILEIWDSSVHPSHSLLGPGAKFPTVATMFLSSLPLPPSPPPCFHGPLPAALPQPAYPASRAALVGFECTKMTRSFRPQGLLGKIFQNTHTHTEPKIFPAEPN